MKALEIIDEAASKVSDSTRTAHPEISWRIIIAMRNRLIHMYFEVNPEVIWQTVCKDLPELAEALESTLQRRDTDEADE